jgi:hypothetical protein
MRSVLFIALFALAVSWKADAVRAAESKRPSWTCWHSADGLQKGAQVIGLDHDGDVITVHGAAFMEIPGP